MATTTTTTTTGPKPPPPPRSKKPRKPRPELSPGSYDDEESFYKDEMAYSPGRSILDMEPETTIGETLVISGKLQFERLLRLEGKFEGDLVSHGDLILGPRGEVVGDVVGMNEVVVFGKVIGKINVEKLELCGSASIYGDITCKTLHMDPTVVLVGALNVNPYAPQLVNKDGSIVTTQSNGTLDGPVEDAMLENDEPPKQKDPEPPKKVEEKEPVAQADGVGDIPLEEPPKPSDPDPPGGDDP